MSDVNYSHFQITTSISLTEYLLHHVGLSRSRTQTLFEFGAFFIDGVRTRAETDLASGNVLRVHFNPKRYSVPATIAVVFEDADFLVIDKPPGVPTHPTLDNYLENAWFHVQVERKQKLYVTHRLDIGTQGLLVFAKNPDAQASLNRELRKRRVTKIYRAITEVAPPVGRFEHHMLIDPRPPKPVSATASEGSCNAILDIKKVWSVPEGFACEIELETGRTHQIRAQLAFLGCPILGDKLYGSKTVHERLALECCFISFAHRSRTIGIYRPTPLVAPHSTKDS